MRISSAVAIAIGCVLLPGCAKKAVVIEPPMVVRDLRKEVDPVVRWTPEVVPPEKNGWDLVIKATKAVPDKLDKESQEVFATKGGVLPDPDRASKPDIEKVLAACKPYERGIEILGKAAQRPVWLRPGLRDDIVPDVEKEAGILFPEYAKVKTLAKTLAMRARAKYALGDTKGAVKDLTLAYQTGDRMSGHSTSIIQQLVGIACESIAMRQIQSLAPRSKWSNRDLQTLLAFLPERKMGERTQRTLRAEFDNTTVRMTAGLSFSPTGVSQIVGEKNKDQMASVISANSHPLDRKQTIRDISQMYRETVLNATRPYQEQVPVDRGFAAYTSMWPPEIYGIDSEPSKQIWDKARSNAAKTSNPLGRLICFFCYSSNNLAEIADRRTLAAVRATKAIVATELYRRRHHAEPPSLAALVKDGLLKSEPMDPFSTHPLRYDAGQQLIWSVGPKTSEEDAGDPNDRNGHQNGYAWPTNGVFPLNKKLNQ